MPLTRRSTFRDRREAGRMLAARLSEMDLDAPVVIALPRGGVPVGFEVARALGAPLDVGLVRKIGHPSQPELGIGAIGEDGSVVVDRRALEAFAIDDEQVELIAAREAEELDRRRRLYRGDAPPAPVRDRTVVVVDDGIATGVTAAAAARVLKAQGAARVILAVPVCPAGTPERIDGGIDEVVTLAAPERFGSVGAWYDDFSQTSDREVVELLAAARPDVPAAGPGVPGEVTIPTADGVELGGFLRLPPDPTGLVVFVHGSGSSRHSPRNASVARYLEGRGLATLLFDLLTPAEAADRRLVFDIELLSQRLGDAIRWSRGQGAAAGLPLACFGASTGAAAALTAAAEPGAGIAAVVSRGGRPDLAGATLRRVTVPVLLIVGGADTEVLALNRAAATELAGPCRLAVVPGAGHLFEEPGTLAQAARLAADFLEVELAAAEPGARPAGGAR
ncbi:MAG: phosphoribosyltransferase [Thermoleophilia bacterium]|nr:phosphoribosyltransferase [Thermoleophilia bacterium]GIK76411.1 MAG: putative phosphoribosyl transferase [Actinomycetes bacterium]